jgi:hypothetical protein
MRKSVLLAAVTAILAVAATAAAAEPTHFRSVFPYQFVDTQTCAFPIVGDFVFTNDGTEFDNADGTISSLQLHQSNVGTLTGNSVTLTENEHTQTFVTFVDGAASQAAHVGTLFHLVGPNGRDALVAGQQVFEVENGFDTTLIAEHGVAFDFSSDAAFCAAFA